MNNKYIRNLSFVWFQETVTSPGQDHLRLGLRETSRSRPRDLYLLSSLFVFIAIFCTSAKGSDIRGTSIRACIMERHAKRSAIFIRPAPSCMLRCWHRPHRQTLKSEQMKGMNAAHEGNNGPNSTSLHQRGSRWACRTPQISAGNVIKADLGRARPAKSPASPIT